MGAAGFRVKFPPTLDVMGVPIDRPIPVVFRETLPVLLELAAGCLAIVEELVDPKEPEGSLVEFGRPMRDDTLEPVLREESIGLLRPGLVVDGVIGPPRRVRVSELTAGCVTIVEVDGSLAVIFLPIRDCELLLALIEILLLCPCSEAGCLDAMEFDGCPLVI